MNLKKSFQALLAVGLIVFAALPVAGGLLEFLLNVVLFVCALILLLRAE